MIKFIKEVFQHFIQGNTFQKGAALAYYAVFSLLPMIVIITAILGIFFGKEAVSGEIYTQLKGILGDTASLQIQNLIKNQHQHHNNTLTAVIGFATLALSASGMFSQIHNAFNDLWNIKSKPKSSLLQYFSKHLVSFTILIGLFFIILISTTLNSFLFKYVGELKSNTYQLYIYEHMTALVIFSIIFTIMFRFLGDAVVYWKAALFGGIFTSVLFAVGKMGIGMYIGRSHLSTTFGSASVLALVMLWVYYTSQIIFLGASFVEVISRKLGHAIQPDTNAVRIESVELTE